MKRLDLIISAIEDALKDFATDSYGYDYRGCCGADLDVGHTADCKLAQALAAARELKDELYVKEMEQPTPKPRPSKIETQLVAEFPCDTCAAPNTPISIMFRCGTCYYQNGKPPTKYVPIAIAKAEGDEK